LQVLNAVSEVVNQSLFLEKILNGAITTLTQKILHIDKSRRHLILISELEL